jgi:hypothetical protein
MGIHSHTLHSHQGLKRGLHEKSTLGVGFRDCICCASPGAVLQLSGTLGFVVRLGLCRDSRHLIILQCSGTLSQKTRFTERTNETAQRARVLDRSHLSRRAVNLATHHCRTGSPRSLVSIIPVGVIALQIPVRRA